MKVCRLLLFKSLALVRVVEVQCAPVHVTSERLPEGCLGLSRSTRGPAGWLGDVVTFTGRAVGWRVGFDDSSTDIRWDAPPWGKRSSTHVVVACKVYHLAPGLWYTHWATTLGSIGEPPVSDEPLPLPSGEGTVTLMGHPKPGPSTIDDAAPKESVDNWPLAIIISDTLGGMFVYR
jgi:hypothetical protein